MRLTYLAARPAGIRHWLGHAEPSMTDSDSKIAYAVGCRSEVADKIEGGFAIPATLIVMVHGNRRKAVDRLQRK
jgi:hypothetical protein